MSGKRVAHFLLHPELADSPPNEALISIYQRCGLGVDIYSPSIDRLENNYGPNVRLRNVEYGKRWLSRALLSTSWRQYVAFSGTTEDPISVVGLLSFLYRQPSLVLADEIRSGSYSGKRDGKWKMLCRWGMRRAVLSIVNDGSRVSLQREYAGLDSEHPVVVYPGCFRKSPEPGDREELRRARDIPSDALVVCYSGVFNYGNGGSWTASLLSSCKDVYLLAQIPDMDPLVKSLFVNITGSDRLYLEPRRLTWQESWSSMSAVDIGLVLYLQDAPQFRNMGTSSNRLCMFLSMGVPVVATRQRSFQFIEDYGAGVLIDSQKELPGAINQISADLRSMRKNAKQCAEEYIAVESKYGDLAKAVEGNLL